MGRTVAYVRVSPAEQDSTRQLAAIGVVDQVFEDRTGGKSTTRRTGLAELIAWVADGDTVRVFSMSRLARSAADLAQIVTQIVDKGVRVEFIDEQLSFTPGADDPFAAFQMRILTAVAQLERNLIKERQREGIALAKQRGVYRGRAKILTPSQIAEARSKVDAGVPKARIARELGCGRTSLYAALEGKGAYAPNPKARGPQ